MSNLFPLIEISRINDLDSQEYRSMIEIYLGEFPAEERKTVKQLETLIIKSTYTLLVAKQQNCGKIMGFALVMFNSDPEFTFIDYMAVDPLFQGWGVGTNLFNSIFELQKASSLGVLLEVEPLGSGDGPDAINKRRYRFYTRLGCYPLKDIKYKLPRINSESIPLDLMFKPNPSLKVLSAETIKALIVTVYDNIHFDIPDRYLIYQEYLPTITDQYFR